MFSLLSFTFLKWEARWSACPTPRISWFFNVKKIKIKLSEKSWWQSQYNQTLHLIVVWTPVDLLGNLKLLWDWFSESWDFLNKKTVKFDDLKWYRARAVNLLQLLTLPYLAQVTRLSRKASDVFVLPADREQFSKNVPPGRLKTPWQPQSAHL